MFVLRQFCDLMTSDPSLIMDGASPLQIKFKKVCFKDTFKYFMCLLAALPKQFHLPIEKGNFPHEFNTPDNQTYVSPLLEEKYFGTRFMTQSRYKKFKEWYDEERSLIETGTKPLWNFQIKLHKYCENDVDVLMQAWVKFQTKMHELTSIYPGGKMDVSTASYTNLVWKST